MTPSPLPRSKVGKHFGEMIGQVAPLPLCARRVSDPQIGQRLSDFVWIYLPLEPAFPLQWMKPDRSSAHPIGYESRMDLDLELIRGSQPVIVQGVLTQALPLYVVRYGLTLRLPISPLSAEIVLHRAWSHIPQHPSPEGAVATKVEKGVMCLDESRLRYVVCFVGIETVFLAQKGFQLVSVPSVDFCERLLVAPSVSLDERRVAFSVMRIAMRISGGPAVERWNSAKVTRHREAVLSSVRRTGI
jgi:hypothetical protein